MQVRWSGCRFVVKPDAQRTADHRACGKRQAHVRCQEPLNLGGPAVGLAGDSPMTRSAGGAAAHPMRQLLGSDLVSCRGQDRGQRQRCAA